MTLLTILVLPATHPLLQHVRISVILSAGAGQNVTVFGRVPSQTTPAPAAYSDTIITTVTY
jgi:spore coat protein U-like protein